MGSGWRRLGGEEGSYISDLQVMDDGVLGDIEIIGVDNLEQEDGLHKSTLLIQLQSGIWAVGGKHPHSVTLRVSRASRCCSP